MIFHSFNGEVWRFRDSGKEIRIEHENGLEAWEKAHEAMIEQRKYEAKETL